MTDAATTSKTPQADAPPPFEPDPNLIDHLEGNERTIQRYRHRAEEMRKEAHEASRG